MISELPSCVYAAHDLSSSAGNGNPFRLNSANIRQLQYLHHSDCLETASQTPPINPAHYAPYKIQRQHGGVRERKRMVRSAPNG